MVLRRWYRAGRYGATALEVNTVCVRCYQLRRAQFPEAHTYKSLRRAAAEYMLAHEHDFRDFLALERHTFQVPHPPTCVSTTSCVESACSSRGSVGVQSVGSAGFCLRGVMMLPRAEVSRRGLTCVRWMSSVCVCVSTMCVCVTCV